MVSVSMALAANTGGERFGAFVIDVPQRQTVDFKAVGVHESFSGPDSPPKRPTS
jgi:hypothetical protein